MNRYLCKCGRSVNKSTNADNTGNRETEGCEGCPYLMPWGPTEWDHTRHAMVTDVKGYECRMSPTLEYRTELRGHLDDKMTIRITSLDFDFLECVSDWVKEHYPNGELSGGFSRDRIRPAEYVDEGRYRYTLACSQNKKGIAAKRALWAEFFDETFHRKDMDADAEKQKILRDIEQGKAAAHKDAAATDKETNTMLIYRDPATGWLYRVSPQPEHGSYVMQYRDPANSATWKWCANWNIGNIYRESLEEVLEARAKRDGWELVSSSASSEPPEVVDKGEEYSPCDTCRCPDCIDSSCPQAGCDKTDGGFGCFAPYEECPAPAEETCPDERLEKEVGKCNNQSAPNGDAAATTAGSAVPEPAETSTTPTDANTLPAPGCPADAGSATQSLSAAGPASLEAEPEATPFDYSGLDDQTVADLHLAEREYSGGKKMAEIGILNGLIDSINWVIEKVNGISFTNPFTGNTVGFNFPSIGKIPYLAQGAVIPPNREFMAVLGDQSSGTNIEAPLETIKQALSEVMTQQGGGDITIKFTGDLAQLARVLHPVIEREQHRRGTRLVKGVV